MANPGDQFPPGSDWIVRKLQDLQRQIDENASARSLAASQIGQGGLVVNNGGSITIQGTGSLNVGSGALNSAGSITAGTTITAGGALSGSSVTATSGDVTAAGNVTAGSNMSSPNVFGTSIFAANAGNVAGNITAPRTTLWARNSDGYIGNTLSSIRFKTNVTDSGIDPLAVLAFSVKHYQYIAELRKRDDPTFEFYVGPHYHVALEIGGIAEELHELGLWEFVIYEHEYVAIEDDRPQSEDLVMPELIERLVLDADGNPVPQSIHYELLALAVLVATQHVWAEHLKVRADTDRILEHLGI